MSLDPRLNAYRADLAHARLAGSVEAARFVEPQQRQVTAPLAAVLDNPSGKARQVTQALMGETVGVLEEQGSWCWVQLQRDGYVGHMSSASLGKVETRPTHRVSVPLALSFPEPDIKSQPAIALPLNAEFTAHDHDDRFLKLADGRFICRVHVQPAGEMSADFVSVAMGFTSVPYLWGGKSFMGLDCSGLVQVSLQACGISCPRDADMQEAGLGDALPGGAGVSLQRGDLVFWDGHVGIMTDARSLLHANGYHMRVVCEPLQEAISRIAAGGSPVTSIRRLQ